jgi:pimeloyl-ACP methyl ester carboxylesterase
LLIHGDQDDIIDPATQSSAFLAALKRAGFFAHTVVIPGAGHFFVTDPVDDTSFGRFAGRAGHAGATANLKLTFDLDHSAGAEHPRAQKGR